MILRNVSICFSVMAMTVTVLSAFQVMSARDEYRRLIQQEQERQWQDSSNVATRTKNLKAQLAQLSDEEKAALKMFLLQVIDALEEKKEA